MSNTPLLLLWLVRTVLLSSFAGNRGNSQADGSLHKRQVCLIAARVPGGNVGKRGLCVVGVRGRRSAARKEPARAFGFSILRLHTRLVERTTIRTREERRRAGNRGGSGGAGRGMVYPSRCTHEEATRELIRVAAKAAKIGAERTI